LVIKQIKKINNMARPKSLVRNTGVSKKKRRYGCGGKLKK
jgi:hypothetical protein